MIYNSAWTIFYRVNLQEYIMEVTIIIIQTVINCTVVTNNEGIGKGAQYESQGVRVNADSNDEKTSRHVRNCQT